MELPSGCVNLKVQQITGTGFLWGFEFLTSTKNINRKTLLRIETRLKKCSQIECEKSYQKGEFVAIYMDSWKRYLRGYVTSVTSKNEKVFYEVFLIDYGLSTNVDHENLKKLPEFASVDQLAAQSWRICIHGVLPLVQETGGLIRRKVRKSWTQNEIRFIEYMIGGNETIEFKEITKVGDYNFGIIYLKDPATGKLTTLQEMLVNNEYAVQVKQFDRYIPSIIRKFHSDHISFTSGDDENDVFSDSESFISIDHQNASNPCNPSSNHSVTVPEQSPQSGTIQQKGRGRGELLASFLNNSPSSQISPTNITESISRPKITSEEQTTPILPQTTRGSSPPEILPENHPEPSKKPRGRGEILASLTRNLSSTPFNSPSLHNTLPASSSIPNIIPEKPTPGLTPKNRGRGVLLAGIEMKLASSSTSANHAPVSHHKAMTPSVYQSDNDLVPKEPEDVPKKKESSPSAALTYDSMFSTQATFEDKLINKIMVLGNRGVCSFEPKFSMDDFVIHSDVKSRLGQLRINNLTQCQRYMIPAVLTRRNVTLVDAPGGGKTLSCLVGLVSLLKDEDFYSALPVGAGPRAIILCPYSSRCEYIYTQCNEIAKSSVGFNHVDGLRINVAYGCGEELEKEKRDELTKGYDIVICTPSCLLRLLKTPELFNFKRLCHLVLDEAHSLYNSYADEVNEIVKQAYISGRKCQDGLILPQRVIISNEWLPLFKKMTVNDVTKNKGVLLLSSYYEAAIFSKIGAKLKLIDSEERKKNDLLNYLKEEAPNKATVIVFNNVEQLDEIFDYLQSNLRRPVKRVAYCRSNTEEIVMDWERLASRGQNPVILCTDNTLHDLYIHEADSLVHYNLSDRKSEFSTRFSTLLYRLTPPREFYEQEKSPVHQIKPETLIYIERDNYEQFPKIVNLMERLGVGVPQELKNISKDLLRARELENDNHILCENFKKFGRCDKKEKCEFRHYFSPKYDKPAGDIPKEGMVKVAILQTYSASHYCVRLLEHRNGSSQWEEIKSVIHPGVLNFKINKYYSNRNNRFMHVCKNIGEVAAIETTSDLFKRVQILEFHRSEKTNELISVKVKFIDEGKIDDVRPSVLVKLPEEFATIPATTVDLILCNILPIDRDIEWGNIISSVVRQRIRKLQDSEDIIFMGEIQLVSGRNIWIDPLQCKRIYTSERDNVTIISSMGKDLIRKKVAVENAEHLPRLLSMYQSAGLHLPEIENNTPETSSNLSLAPEAGCAKKKLTEGNGPSTRQPINEPREKDESTTSDSLPEDNADTTENTPETSNSEEDWSFNERETSVIPIHNQTAKEQVQPQNLNDDDSDDEYKLYDFDGPGVLNKNGLDEEFDFYYGDDMVKDIGEAFYPGVFNNINFSNCCKTTTKMIENSPINKSPIINDRYNGKEIVTSPKPKHFQVPDKIIIKPKVEWYQDTEYVYLNVFLNVDKYKARCTKDRVYFSATLNDKNYEFNEALYTIINESGSRHYKSSVIIIFKMEKLIKLNKWPRLFKDREVKHWIKESISHLEEDMDVPEMYWEKKLIEELALKPFNDQKMKYNNVYPEGYVATEYLSDSDSDCDFEKSGYDG